MNNKILAISRKKLTFFGSYLKGLFLMKEIIIARIHNPKLNNNNRRLGNKNVCLVLKTVESLKTKISASIAI